MTATVAKPLQTSPGVLPNARRQAASSTATVPHAPSLVIVLSAARVAPASDLGRRRRWMPSTSTSCLLVSHGAAIVPNVSSGCLGYFPFVRPNMYTHTEAASPKHITEMRIARTSGFSAFQKCMAVSIYDGRMKMWVLFLWHCTALRVLCGERVSVLRRPQRIEGGGGGAKPFSLSPVG